MDSSYFVQTLEPSKIYFPKCWNKFLDLLSKPHDLSEKMVLVNKAKFLLENEVVRLATSLFEPFSISTEIVKNGEGRCHEKFKTTFTYAYMSKGKGVAKEGTLNGRCFASGFDHEEIDGITTSRIRTIHKYRVEELNSVWMPSRLVA
ncbi:hypothetical protein L6452_44438 [Arctium lappa]|uniref:Uncharacterized protein n=1 Tax=Arctium lappa TaxID=4217 RepID=A0ACB8XF90_ARCLA|nr:hypothetical protein L6452_44438 [Arctium lappa]